eukprot:scaffold6942_cov88-Cylindrotheca_fusiformis.AAC.2
MMTDLKENNSTPASVAVVASSSNRKKKQTKETLLKETSIHCSKGCTEWKAGNTEMALQEFIQALYIMESTLLSSTLHSLMAKTYFWIGFILQKSGSIDYEKCLEAFTMSFRIQIIMQQQQLLLHSNNNKKDDNNTTTSAAAAAIEEAKRSVRWAYQKLLVPKDHDAHHLFVEALQRSVEYEQQGDILLLHHSNKNDDTPVRSALEKYQQAVAALYDQQHHNHHQVHPQLFAKIAAAKCHLASAGATGGNNDPKEEALLYYRKAVFGFWNSKIYPHHGHPRLNEMWEQIILLLPKQCDDDDDQEESSSLKKEDYIQAATDSMKHQQKAQEQVGHWTSHYHLLQAIHSELKFCTSPNHPIVIDLIQKIDIHILKMEAKFQVRIGREWIVAEALIFDGNKGDDDDAARRRRRRLCQLERFYDRATKCLQILEKISDDQEEEKVQDQQQQQQQEETMQTSSTTTWKTEQEENWLLERQIHLLELVYYIMSYNKNNNNNSVPKKPDVKTQRINELTEELAMLSVTLMQVREKLSSDDYYYGNNAHRQQLVSNMASLHQKIAFREASLEMLQNNNTDVVSKSSNKNHENESNDDVARTDNDDAKHLLQSCLDEARIDCRINQQETKLLVEPIRMETKHESMPVAIAAAPAVAPVEELSLEDYEWKSSGSTTVSGSVLSEAEEIVRKSNECIAKLKLQIEEGGDLTSKAMVRREEIIMDSHEDAKSQNMTNNNAHQNSTNAEGYCEDVSKSENRSTAGGNSPDRNRVSEVVVGVSAESGLKNNGGDVNNSMSDAIESTNNTFKSRTAIYTVGLDTNRRNNGGFHDERMFNDKESFDVTDP